MIKVEINIDPKDNILDPQGKTVEHALKNLNFSEVTTARIGKHIILTVDSDDKATVLKRSKEMCDNLLSNPLIEKYSVKILE